MEFQVELTYRKRWKFTTELVGKMMQKNMKIHEKLMKNHTRKPTFEKRG